MASFFGLVIGFGKYKLLNMNYGFLDTSKALPNFLKPIGIAIVIICLLFGLYLKLSYSEAIFEMTAGSFRNIYFAALVMIILSKAKIEDERSEEFKIQIMKLGYRMVIFLILIYECSYSTDEKLSLYANLFYWIASILGFQIILLLLFENTRIIDLITNNKFFYELLVFIVLITLLLFNYWLW